MKRFPRFILVLAYSHYNKYKDASDAITEYLDGLPHIKKKCCGEYINTTFYIVQNTAGFHQLLDKLTHSAIANAVGYSVYARKLGSSIPVYKKCPYASSCNSLNMPSSIQIPTKDIDSFINITKVTKYG